MLFSTTRGAAALVALALAFGTGAPGTADARGAKPKPAKVAEAKPKARPAARPPSKAVVGFEAEAPRPYLSCGAAPAAFVEAAAKNASTIDSLGWAPFGPPETGWQIYETVVGREIGTTCGGGTPVFAQALARWQLRYGLPGDGVFGPETFQVFKGVVQERRPFVMSRVQGLCPDAPPALALSMVPAAQEAFDREDRILRTDVLVAYNKMLAAARAESPAIRNDPKAMTIFSGYRSPESDGERCLREGNCDGARRAACSPHRTGTAVDLNVGWIDGDNADTTALENRKWQVRSPAYLWLVQNAHRFGFVNYAFEPWHWEFVGDGIGPEPRQAVAAADEAIPASATANP